MIDLEQVRKDTPGCEKVIHFNNAGASLITRAAYDAFTSYLEDELYGGGYETAHKHRDYLESFYDVAAQLINANSHEIAFTENATLAWDMAFYSLPFDEGDVIITSEIEYASNYIAYLQVQKRTGAKIKIIPSTETGEVDLVALRNILQEGDVKLISITHIPTNGGIVNPAEKIGALAEEYGALYLLDACQSVGQYPVDVEKIKCHLLSTTGRKYLRGPRGTGFLYVKEELLDKIEPVMLDLHSAKWETKDSYSVREDGRKFERWETNYAAKYSFTKAIEYLLNLDVDDVWQRVQLLAAELRDELSALPDVEVLDRGQVQSGIVTFRSEVKDSFEIKNELAQHHINTAVAVRNHTLIDMEARGIENAVRTSVHYYNSEKEIATFISALKTVLQAKGKQYQQRSSPP